MLPFYREVTERSIKIYLSEYTDRTPDGTIQWHDIDNTQYIITTAIRIRGLFSCGTYLQNSLVSAVQKIQPSRTDRVSYGFSILRLVDHGIRVQCRINQFI